jgi:hypothetical protein
MGGHVIHLGEMKNSYKILDGVPEGKRLLGGLSRRWQDNIEMDSK